MSRPVKLVIGLFALVIVLMAGLYGYRRLMLWEGRTPEGYPVLTALPGSQSFEPARMPADPVLKNRSSGDVALAFGYKVGAIAYSYELNLHFAASAETGRATLDVHHGTRGASVATEVVRRWDAPRNAYAVALQDKLDTQPPVPSLCIKAVIGPRIDNYDLTNATLCVAQRDASGSCHPETLACGLVR